MSLGATDVDATFVLLATLFTLQLGLPLVLLGLLLSHLSTLVADVVAVVVVVDADAEAAAAATESNDGGNAIEAIVVADVAATIFGEEALRTQLSKLDTKVSSTVEPTPPTVLVEGDAALYSVAEVICLPISGIMAGKGDTDAEDAAAAGNGLPATLVNADELAVVNEHAVVMSSCCCLSLLAGGRDTTTR